jgi:hypothetical protein
MKESKNSRNKPVAVKALKFFKKMAGNSERDKEHYIDLA